MRIYTELSAIVPRIVELLTASRAERRIGRALRAWLRPRRRRSLRMLNALAILFQLAAVLAWAG